jgi:glycogen debranching enzyme
MHRVGEEPNHEIASRPTQAGDERTLVLASGDTFAIFDRHGEMRPARTSRHGLYSGGTRFLSGLWVQIAGCPPLWLSSGARGAERSLYVHETNPDVRDDSVLELPSGQVHVIRRVRIEDGACEIELTLRSFATEPIGIPVGIGFDADYADVFEVRGTRRIERGRTIAPEIAKDTIQLGYAGLDGVLRYTRFEFDPPPARAGAHGVEWPTTLAPGERSRIAIRISCEIGAGGRRQRPGRYAIADGGTARSEYGGRVSTSDHEMNEWIRRSAADIAMLTAPTAHGPMPYAGIPWFCTPFGRDSLTVALETLWISPALARGVLRFLAAHQADADDPDTDAEPGKIVHEMRSGEMAALREVPFGRYYGSVDATPLFGLVAAAYFERTGDVALLEELWPHLERALAWIDGPGDPDGDGFVEYLRRSPTGLRNQGWKDSRDSIMHADGRLAEGPIALCEVQAYVYGARAGLARVARRLGRDARAAQLARDAERTRAAFADAFWCDELATYAIALDGHKRQCRVRSSNAGHVLLTGLAAPDHAAAIARTLLSDDHFSGWGVRTLAASAPRYNPMSYHDGSVWPHDNAIIAAGLARYGHIREATAIFAGLFDACRALDDAVLPELFCGFERFPGEPPTLYPTACSPQAWAAGAVFLLLQAVLGLAIDGDSGIVEFAAPTLPAGLDRISIQGLEIRGGSVDLALERSGNALALHVLRAHEGVAVRQRPSEAGTSLALG